MAFTYQEDYANYARGFWNYVLSGSLELILVLDDGQGFKTFFRGKKADQYLTADIISLVTANEVYQGSFSCLSSISILRSTQSFDVFDEVTPIVNAYTIKYADSLYPWRAGLDVGTDSYTVRLFTLIESILAIGFGQSYEASYSDIIYPSVEDLVYTYPGVDVPPDEVEIQVGYDTGAGLNLRNIFLSAGWGASNLYNLLVALCKSSLWIPRYVYDYTNDRHKIELLTRGRSYTGNTFAESPFAGKYKEGAFIPLYNLATRGFGAMVGAAVPYADYDYLQEGTIGTGEYPSGAGSANEFTFQFMYPFSDSDHNYAYTTALADVWLNSGVNRITHGKVWDYTNAGWYSSTNLLLTYFSRKWGLRKRGQFREYAQMKASYGGADTQDNNYILRPSTISMLGESIPMIPVEITKYPDTGFCDIEWQEI